MRKNKSSGKDANESSNPSKKKRKTTKPDGDDDVHGNYASQAYWQERYESKDGYHNWYYSFTDLEPIIITLLGNDHANLSTATVLEIGCGDSPILDGFLQYGAPTKSSTPRLHGIDFAPNIISHLTKSQSPHSRQHIKYTCLDATVLSSSFSKGMFDLIIDKGTMDAMLCEPTPLIRHETVKKYLLEAFTCLSITGACVVISHMQHDSDEFQEILAQCIMPAMGECVGRRWGIECHVDSGGTEGDEMGGRQGAAVHVLRSMAARVTRSNAPVPVTMTVHEYEE